MLFSMEEYAEDSSIFFIKIIQDADEGLGASGWSRAAGHSLGAGCGGAE